RSSPNLSGMRALVDPLLHFAPPRSTGGRRSRSPTRLQHGKISSSASRYSVRCSAEDGEAQASTTTPASDQAAHSATTTATQAASKQKVQSQPKQQTPIELHHSRRETESLS